MRSTTAAALESNLAAEIEQIKADGESLAIVGDDGVTAAVIVAAEKRGSRSRNDMEHLRKSVANARQLDEAIARLSKGRPALGTVSE